MAALCPGLAQRPRRTQSDPRHDFQAGWHAGGFRRAGRFTSRAKAGSSSGLVVSTSPDQHGLRGEPGRHPAHHPWNRNDESASEENDNGAPEIFQAGGLEDDLAPRAFDVAIDPAGLRGIYPRPADDGDGGQAAEEAPAQIGPVRTGKAEPQRLAAGRQIGKKPSDG